MATVNHRVINTNGINMHIAEQGQGPLVILCHGFPELWYSWRHQLPALAEAGYHVVAPDQRGYGQTDMPDAIEAYTLLHLTEIWWGSSRPWARSGQSSSDTTGALRLPGSVRCYGQTSFMRSDR